MNVALILQQSFGAAIRKMRGGWGAQPQSFAPSLRTDFSCRAGSSRNASAVIQRRPAPPCIQVQKAKPLRVLRFVDSNMPRASVGRMVMSGSMADVCAELDRLAAQELAVH